MATRVGFEPVTLHTQGTELTTEPHKIFISLVTDLELVQIWKFASFSSKRFKIYAAIEAVFSQRLTFLFSVFLYWDSKRYWFYNWLKFALFSRAISEDHQKECDLSGEESRSCHSLVVDLQRSDWYWSVNNNIICRYWQTTVSDIQTWWYKIHDHIEHTALQHVRRSLILQLPLKE